MAMLKKRPKLTKEPSGDNVEAKTTKRRQRLFDFFRSRRKKAIEADGVPNSTPQQSVPIEPPRDSKLSETQHVKPTTTDEQPTVPKDKSKADHMPTPPPEPAEPEPKVHTLSEEDIHKLFSGAPQFFVHDADGTRESKAVYPWDTSLNVQDTSDCLPLAHPAYALSTLRRHPPIPKADVDGKKKPILGYEIGVVEMPSMVSAQGIEPGSIGYDHFLQLPFSDSLATSEDSRTENGVSESVRNKELLHRTPEKLGIRDVDMSVVHERLVDLGDIWDALRDGPDGTSILNNQSSGDLYANLFGKFLGSPRYDRDTEDPTGLKVQIETLLKVLKLPGVWFDFSLVEWRIRLGSVLWADPDAPPDEEELMKYGPSEKWTERNVLLLQILLACELLLRLDAITGMSENEIKQDVGITQDEYKNFLNLKTRKTDWDLVVARRFMENVQALKSDDIPQPETPKARGIFSMLGRPEEPKEELKSDIIFVPRHQQRQLSGLLHFAECLRWPNNESIATDLGQKLHITPPPASAAEQPSSYTRFLDPNSPTSPSVYGTPLATPRSVTSAKNSYFGNVNSRPGIDRSTSARSFNLQLTTPPAWPDANGGSVNPMDIGGWLSRSYLTGLILPGEAMAHFMISTLLENDKLAITVLGDSANLYGGFVYGDRSWWSKSSVVGRVLACHAGTTETMGWISIPSVPYGIANGWFAIDSEEMRYDKGRIDTDALARDSDTVPDKEFDNLKSEDLVLPQDPTTPPVPSIGFMQWALSPMPTETAASPTTETSETEQDTPLDMDVEPDASSYRATFTFQSLSTYSNHDLALHHDISFISSYPCTAPSAASSSPLLQRSNSTKSLRPIRRNSRRNSYGFDPLSSHPPSSAAGTPLPLEEEMDDVTTTRPMAGHPMLKRYPYRVAPVTDVLNASFVAPEKPEPVPTSFNDDKKEGAETGSVMGDVALKAAQGTKAVLQGVGVMSGDASNKDGEEKHPEQKEREILVLDARGSWELELVGRAWCSSKGYHAIIGRVGRTCLGCCVREARGIGVAVVIRV